MHVFAEPPFAAHEFYPAGKQIIVPTNEGETTVYRFGDARLEHTDGRQLITPDDFRAEFPDGVLPEDDTDWRWLNNGWFNDDPDDEHPDDISYDLVQFGFSVDPN